MIQTLKVSKELTGIMSLNRKAISSWLCLWFQYAWKWGHFVVPIFYIRGKGYIPTDHLFIEQYPAFQHYTPSCIISNLIHQDVVKNCFIERRTMGSISNRTYASGAVKPGKGLDFKSLMYPPKTHLALFQICQGQNSF